MMRIVVFFVSFVVAFECVRGRLNARRVTTGVNASSSTCVGPPNSTVVLNAVYDVNCEGESLEGESCSYTCAQDFNFSGSKDAKIVCRNGAWEKENQNDACIWQKDRNKAWNTTALLAIILASLSPFFLYCYGCQSELFCAPLNPIRKTCPCWCLFPAPSVYAYNTWDGEETNKGENRDMHLYWYVFAAFFTLGGLILLSFHLKDAHEASQWTYRSDLEILGSYETILSKNKERTKNFGIYSCYGTRPHRECFCIKGDQWRTDCYIAQYRVRWTCQEDETRGKARVCEDWFRDLRHMWTYHPNLPDAQSVLSDGVVGVSGVKAFNNENGNRTYGWVDCSRRSGCTVRAMGGKGTNEVIYGFELTFLSLAGFFLVSGYLRWLYYECKLKYRKNMSASLALQKRHFDTDHDIELTASGLHLTSLIPNENITDVFYEVPISTRLLEQLRASIVSVTAGCTSVEDCIQNLKKPVSLFTTRPCVVPQLYEWYGLAEMDSASRVALVQYQFPRVDEDAEDTASSKIIRDDNDDETAATKSTKNLDDDDDDDVDDNAMPIALRPFRKVLAMRRVKVAEALESVTAAFDGAKFDAVVGFGAGVLTEIDPLLLEDARSDVFVDDSKADDHEPCRCPQDHLMQIRTVTPVAYNSGTVTCDICGLYDIVNKGSFFEHCALCRYDICSGCSRILRGMEAGKYDDDDDDDDNDDTAMKSSKNADEEDVTVSATGSWGFLNWDADATTGSHVVPAEFICREDGTGGEFISDINGVHRRNASAYKAFAQLVTSLMPHFERVSSTRLCGKIVPIVVRTVSIEIQPGGFYVDTWKLVDARAIGGIAAAICVYDNSVALEGGDLELNHGADSSKVTLGSRRIFPSSGKGKSVVFGVPDTVHWRFSQMSVPPQHDSNVSGVRRFVQLMVFPASSTSRKLLHRLPVLTSRYRRVNQHRNYLLWILRWSVARGHGTAHPVLVHYVLSFLLLPMAQRWRIRQEVLANIERESVGPRGF